VKVVRAKMPNNAVGPYELNEVTKTGAFHFVCYWDSMTDRQRLNLHEHSQSLTEQDQ